MDSPHSLEPADPQPDQEREEETDEGFPMPAPWALAAAVLLLLAFGVLLGRIANSREGPRRVELAAAPTHGASRSVSPPSAPAAESEPEPEEKEESSGTEESEGQEAKEAPEKAAAKEEASEEEAPSKEESSQGSTGAGEKAATSALPPIKHVFLIVLGEIGYEEAFGSAAAAPYLSRSLRQQGELIGDYYAVTSGELANEIAIISGQGPTQQTASDCSVYERLSPGGSGAEGQTLGSGCLYPITTLTIGDQLTAAGDTWKAYVQGLDEGGSASAASCPSPALGSADPHANPSASEPYVTWRDPFLYFSSVTEGSTCGQQNVGIGQLASDLKSATTTPSLSYISPDPCDDGASQPCAPGSPAGLAATEGFLRKVVPAIEESSAYKEGGLIAIASDQAPQSGPAADSSGCCVTPKYPNLPGASTTTSTGLPAGGGRVGLLLISKYVKPNSSNVNGQYNHFSLLVSIEGLFKLQPLGYAGALGLPRFDKTVYNAWR